jgi:hypothetical protein
VRAPNPPTPNPQSPIPNPQIYFECLLNVYNFLKIKINENKFILLLMYNYGYDTTNGQYNIDGQLIYVPSNNNNIYEYNNNYPNYTITNFVNTLPEPEIINNYQVNYQEQYANNNNSSPDYNLYIMLIQMIILLQIIII